MTNSKITERDIYNAMIDGTIDPDVMVEFAEKKLAQLDKRNASAAKRAAAKRAAGDELTEVIFGFVNEDPQTRGQIAAAYNAANDAELSDAKIGAKLTALEKAGRISKEKGKVEGEDGKMKEAILYFIG